MSQAQANQLIQQANQQRDAGHLDEAIAAYREAMVLFPPYRAFGLVVGEMLREQGRYEEAAHAYRDLLDLTPDHDQAWSDLGQCLMMMGQLEKAAHSFGRAIELESEEPDPFYLSAMVHAKLERPDEARRLLQAALRRRPAWRSQAAQDPLLKPYL